MGYGTDTPGDESICKM